MQKKRLVSVRELKRVSLIFIALFFLFSLLIIQFYKIQIIEGEKWKKIALKQHQISVLEPAHRGVFYSNTSIRSGHPESLTPFVVDVVKYHLFVDPKSIPQESQTAVAQALSELATLDPEALRKELTKSSRSRKLKMWISLQEKDKIQRWWLFFAKKHKIGRNAVFFVQDYQRSYPYGKLLGQVLHTLRSDRDPISHQNIPTGGLELSLNRYLVGKDGKRVILRSPRNPLDEGVLIQPPEHGADVYLTINHTLQAIVEEELANAVKNANGKAGWAILMDPHTGEILAFAQVPMFDLACARLYFNNPLLHEHTKIKALTDPFEPGSVMKPLSLMVAFLANEELKAQGKPPLFSPQEKIATGSGMFPGRRKPIVDLSPRKYENMDLAIQKSSNIYVGRLMQRVVDQLGEKWYRKTLQDLFGFGMKTGIELLGESSGMLPTPGKYYKSGAPEWSKATPASLAMGYNVLATSLQMVRAYGILANGGHDIHPTLVRKIVKKKSDGTEEVVFDHEELLGQLVQILPKKYIDEILHSMKFSINPGGTARRAKIPGYTAVGKTGSTEKIVNGTYSKKNHISTFIGFAPVNNPKFVLLVVIDEPEYKYVPGVGKQHLGGFCCSPAFAQIGLRTLQFLGVSPDDPHQTYWKEEIEALKKLDEAWNR